MFFSLTPDVVGGRQRRWLRAAALHLLGGVLGGLVVGVAVAPIALVPLPASVWLLIAAALALAALGDLGLTRDHYPSARRQVPEWWRKFLPVDAFFFLYGFGLGTAFFTRIRSSAIFAAVALGAATGRPEAVILAMALFGLSRSATVLIPTAFLHPYERAMRFVEHLYPRAGLASVAGGAAVAFAAPLLIGG